MDKAKKIQFVRSYFQTHFTKRVHISKHINRATIHKQISSLSECYIVAEKITYPCKIEKIDDELLGLVKLLSIRSNGIRGVYEVKDEHYHIIIKDFLTKYRIYFVYESLSVYMCKDNVKIIYQYIS